MGESYSAAISANSPRSGTDLLRARIHHGERTSQNLVEWLKDYSHLQSKQAAEIERFLSKHVVQEERLGTLAEPWQKIALILVEQSRLANDSAKRTQLEVERSFRESIQAHQQKAEEILQPYQEQGNLPKEAIDGIQELDEIRLNSAKSALARFTTIEVDRAQAMLKVSERAMQAWLSFDPRDEVAAFVAQVVSGVAPMESLSASNSGSAVVGSRQSSQASQSTVRRKSSLLLGSKSEESNGKSPGGLRSKVGSIFGRKKKQSSSSGAGSGGSNSLPPLKQQDSRDSSSNSRPSALEQRKPSQMSVQSHTSSVASSLRQPRTRDTADDELYGSSNSSTPHSAYPLAPLTPTKVHSTTGGANSPRRAQSPLRNSQPPRAASPLRPEVDANPFPHSIPSPAAATAPISSTGNFTQLQQPTHQQQFQSPPQHLQPIQQQQAQSLPLVQQQSGSQLDPGRGYNGNASSSFLSGSYNGAPAPPPARHSIHRQGSLSRSASSASARLQRSNSYNARESRVGSQVFANLPPTNNSEQNDTVAPLPEIPATPQAFNAGGTHGYAGSSNGSPEQFFTPAQRFVPQFEHSNTSVASISHQTTSNYPPLPEGQGLVASAIEHVYAKYVGEELSSSSVKGEAIAQVKPSNQDPTQDHIVLGILLADSNAQLTPSSFLRQTSSLSFEVPYSAYLAQQELVRYHSDTAIGRVPIKIIPQWRFDSKTVRLVLSFQLSELYVGGDSVEIEDLVIAVTLGNLGGQGSARAQSAQSKPVATFSREKQRVTWRFNKPQVLTRGGAATKLLCQFVTDGPASNPGSIELKARLPRVTNSLLQLRALSASGEWIAVPTAVSSDVHQQTSTL